MIIQMRLSYKLNYTLFLSIANNNLSLSLLGSILEKIIISLYVLIFRGTGFVFQNLQGYGSPQSHSPFPLEHFSKPTSLKKVLGLLRGPLTSSPENNILVTCVKFYTYLQNILSECTPQKRELKHLMLGQSTKPSKGENLSVTISSKEMKVDNVLFELMFVVFPYDHPLQGDEVLQLVRAHEIGNSIASPSSSFGGCVHYRLL